MFTKKLTEWTAKNDTSEADIEEFFTKNTFIYSFYEKNSFNGFLIDYEFLLLKKNFIKKLQKNENPSFNALSKKKQNKEMMKGMMTSTIFALDASNIKQSKTKHIDDKKTNLVKLLSQHKNPLIFDFILEYACK
jgi:hypothetical protein